MSWTRVEAILALLSDEILFTLVFFQVLPLLNVRLPLSWYVGIMAVLIGKDLIIVKLIWNIIVQPPQTGKETLIGKSGTAHTDVNPQGIVRIDNELWKAESVKPIKKGEKVRVIKMDGLSLQVEKEK